MTDAEQERNLRSLDMVCLRPAGDILMTGEMWHLVRIRPRTMRQVLECMEGYYGGHHVAIRHMADILNAIHPREQS